MRFEQPPPEPLAGALGFLLSWNGQRIARRFAEALQQVGLRPPHFGVMRVVAAQPGRTQQELVAGAMIDASSMVKVIDELEELGLAERRVDPDDRRKRTVWLTHDGHDALERAMTIAQRVSDEVFAPLSDRERETLRKLLRKLAGGPPSQAGEHEQGRGGHGQRRDRSETAPG